MGAQIETALIVRMLKMKLRPTSEEVYLHLLAIAEDGTAYVCADKYREAGFDRSKVSRALADLEENGLIRRDGNKRVRIAPSDRLYANEKYVQTELVFADLEPLPPKPKKERKPKPKAAAPAEEPAEQKQEPKPKERSVADSENMLMRTDFEEVYRRKTGVEYYWTAKDAGCAKALKKKLVYSIVSMRGHEPDKDQLRATWQMYYEKAWQTDEFVREHYDMSLLNSKYNVLFKKIFQHGQRQDDYHQSGRDGDRSRLVEMLLADVGRNSGVP